MQITLPRTRVKSVLITLFAGITLSICAWADVEATYWRPNANFAQYNSFLISPLDLSDMKIVPPAWITDVKPHRWQLKDKDEAYIRSLYTEYLGNGIRSAGKFDVVSEAAEKVLQVDVKIVRLTPWAKKGDKSGQTMGSGEMKFEVRFRDSVSGDLLGVAEGLQNVGKNYQENVRINHEHNLKDHFFSWGEGLSKALARQKN